MCKDFLAKSYSHIETFVPFRTTPDDHFGVEDAVFINCNVCVALRSMKESIVGEIQGLDCTGEGEQCCIQDTTTCTFQLEAHRCSSAVSDGDGEGKRG
jgi:hypothetical protein